MLSFPKVFEEGNVTTVLKVNDQVIFVSLWTELKAKKKETSNKVVLYYTGSLLWLFNKFTDDIFVPQWCYFAQNSLKTQLGEANFTSLRELIR